LQDKAMCDTIKTVLTDSFLKPRTSMNGLDVYILAASRLAIDFLAEAYKDLEKFKNSKKEPSAKLTNPGL